MVDSDTTSKIELLLAVLAEYLDLDDTDCLSLPPAVYLSVDLYKLEIEKIFKKSWLCVGRVSTYPIPAITTRLMCSAISYLRPR